MDCKIRTINPRISLKNNSAAAQLVVDMCHPWYNPDRDRDDDRVSLSQIHFTSLVQAFELVPKYHENYDQWRDKMGLDKTGECPEFTPEEYEVALKFLKSAAKHHLTAYTSFTVKPKDEDDDADTDAG